MLYLGLDNIRKTSLFPRDPKGSHLEAAALLVDLCFYYENSRNDFLHIIQIRAVEHDLFFEI